MARAGRKDRGLLSKRDTAGKTVWYVRMWHEGKERRFGSFNTKTEARGRLCPSLCPRAPQAGPKLTARKGSPPVQERQL